MEREEVTAMKSRHLRSFLRSSPLALRVSLIALICCATIHGGKIHSDGISGPGPDSPGSSAPVEPSSPPSLPQIVTFRAEPEWISHGGTTRLIWETNDATSVSISGIGSVPLSGSRKVRPSRATTYVLTATGTAGSTVTREASVDVGPVLKAPNKGRQQLENHDGFDLRLTFI